MSVEETADSGIDMASALESMSSELFPDAEPEVEEVDEAEEVQSTEEIEETVEPLAAEEQESAEEEKTTIQAKAPPGSWKKEMHEAWGKLDAATQSYIEQRENQMRDGLSKDRGDANLGRVMRDVMAPFSQTLKAQGIDEPVMVRNLMNAHYRLSTASPQEKLGMIHQIAQSYGIPLDGSDPPKIDPVINSLQQKVQGLEQTITQSHQRTLQEARARVESEVEIFAADHPFFDELAEQIVPLINAGYELKDAYESAIWMNPVTRQKELERTAIEAAAKAKNQAQEEIEKARKAKAPNVRGRDTRKAPTEPVGTMEDTMRETYREIQNRSH